MPILDHNSPLISRDFDDASLPYVHASRYSLPVDPESAMTLQINSFRPSHVSLSSFLSTAPLPLLDSLECNYYRYYVYRISMLLVYLIAALIVRVLTERYNLFYPVPSRIILTRTGNVSRFHNTNLDSLVV